MLPLNIVEGYIDVLHFCFANTIDNDDIHNMYISVVGERVAGAK